MTKPLSLCILFLFLISACAGPQPAGTLQGTVTIGPLVPVQSEGEPTPTPNPAVFEARKIVIYKPNGTTEVTQADIRPDGTYRLDLPAGRYVIDINRIGIDSAAGLPAEIEIIPYQTLTLDIDIDTGIR